MRKKVVVLRSQPKSNFSVDDVQKMLAERDFFDAYKNKNGRGLLHEYKAIERQGEKLVIDHATGLTWQQSGTPDYITDADAKNYIHELNKKGFAGYNDWRLPTLEEAMSLMEPSKKHGHLYIDPVFDKTQWWIWTADKTPAGVAWVVNFYDGGGYDDLYGNDVARAVR